MAKNPDKKSSEYWKKRFQELENRQHGMSVKRAREIMVNFDKATSEIEQKITYWYQRIADNNNISLQEARKLLSDAQLKEFKWSVDDYIKYGKQNAIDGRWMKELENASARAHISRLEALKLQVRNEIEKAYASSEEELVSHMETVFKDSMYHTAYELQKGLDRCETFAKVSSERVRKVMDKPWCPDGKTFSARIWEDRDKLVSSLDTQLTRMCITGAAPDRVIKEMTKLLGAKKSNVARLVMTESAYISSAAQKECFKELDVEQYKVLAVLDSKTSEICQEMDGQVFKMSEYQEGVTAPPFHPNCRSTTIPYFDDEWFKSGSRSARDKDGNYIEVPEDMTYAEWKKKFVDGSEKVDNFDFMGKPQTFKNKYFKVKAYAVDGTDKIYSQTYSKDAQNTIDFVSNMKNKGIINGISKTVVANDFPGIASYDHVDNILYVNEKLLNSEYIEQQLSSGYFVAENAEDVIKHEMFHKKHWDFVMTKGENYANIKHSIEEELHKYVSEQRIVDPLYISRTISINAELSFDCNNSLNELIAEVLLQETNGIVKDDTLLKLVRGCVE